MHIRMLDIIALVGAARRGAAKFTEGMSAPRLPLPPPLRQEGVRLLRQCLSLTPPPPSPSRPHPPPPPHTAALPPCNCKAMQSWIWHLPSPPPPPPSTPSPLHSRGGTDWWWENNLRSCYAQGTLSSETEHAAWLTLRLPDAQRSSLAPASPALLPPSFKSDVVTLLQRDLTPFWSKTARSLVLPQTPSSSTEDSSPLECLEASTRSHLAAQPLDQATPPRQATPPHRPTPSQLSVILLKLREELPAFFNGHHSYDMYAPDVRFENNLGQFSWTARGRESYRAFLTCFRCSVAVAYSSPQLELLKIVKDVDRGRISARWRVKGRWRPALRSREQAVVLLEGLSTFAVDGEGLIALHRMDRVVPAPKERSPVRTWLASLAAVLGLAPKPSVTMETTH